MRVLEGSRWRRTATVLGALAVGGGVLTTAAWVGCSIYDPSLLLPAANEAGGADGVAETAVEAGVDAPDLCPELYPPAKPTADDPSDAGDQTFVVALHTLDLGLGLEGGSPPPIGYDLDHVFTCCEAGPESCKAAKTGATHCDEPEGRDNSGEQLLASLAALPSSPFNASTINQRLQQGVYSIILQIAHYNGQPNDTQVTAALYGSLGIQAVGDAAPPLAAWDGGDVWTLDSNFVVQADASPVLPTHFDSTAYVTNGTLVMHVNFPISLGTSSTGSLAISLTAGVITGTIQPVGGTYRIGDGIIAGRWNVSDLLDSIQYLSFSGTEICRGYSNYTFIKSLICQYADIMTDPTLDKTGTTCDALSIGMAFTTDPANMGSALEPPAKVSGCDAGPDAGPDDCTQP